MELAADLVVSSRTGLECALSYNETEDAAPRLIGVSESGLGADAPRVKDDLLAGALGQLRIGSTVPEKLYVPVADALSRVMLSRR